MRICSLTIENFRAVERFSAKELPDFVVIAGQNGSGKSCVFDAIRLLKSVYGGYSQDEHMQWFSEFAINPHDQSALRAMFRDPTTAVTIQATVEYTAGERAYLADRAADLVWPIAWQRATGQRMDYWTFTRMAVASQLGHFRPEVERFVGELAAQLVEDIANPGPFAIGLVVQPDGNIELKPCLVAEVAFQSYAPQDLGVIDHHSASRSYTRQPLQGINLDSRAFEDQRRTQALYNAQAKYQNVKTELAAGYVRNLIAAAAEESRGGDVEDLNETLKELFRTFFPDKEYLGVRPQTGGSLEFPVRLPGGETHDIDDLSSGEKEILYGYLRLRNSTPKHSIILLDEPELHLNPSLLHGFADFYHRHLGLAQGNQLWMVTHSDALLRQAVGNSNYRVYHMVAAASADGNQASEILLGDDVERAVVDLVGDLAAYRPHAKVVILEGEGAEGFDVTVVRRLFPDIAKRLNLVSGGSKPAVKQLYRALNATAEQIGAHNRFFAITDGDTDISSQHPPEGAVFHWPVYHIENFLLHPGALREACRAIVGKDLFGSDAELLAALTRIADASIEELAIERVRRQVNDDIIRQINLGGSTRSGDAVAAIHPSLRGSLQRVAQRGEAYSEDALRDMLANEAHALRASVADGTWNAVLPGRTILSRFAGEHTPGVSYKVLKNVVLDKLSAVEHKPEEMQDVLQRILDA